jgi:hypothetical protein
MFTPKNQIVQPQDAFHDNAFWRWFEIGKLYTEV